MSRAQRQKKKRSLVLPGQLELFAAPEAANAQKPQAANDALAPVKSAPSNMRNAAPKAAQPSVDIPANSNQSNSTYPEKRPRGRPGKLPPVENDVAAKRTEPRDPYAQSLRHEWWNSQMVCVFLKISRKTLWERRRAKNLNFPQPTLMGGVRNLYRASAIREWAERMADAEF